jgi:hypothetical protein
MFHSSKSVRPNFDQIVRQETSSLELLRDKQREWHQQRIAGTVMIDLAGRKWLSLLLLGLAKQ